MCAFTHSRMQTRSNNSGIHKEYFRSSIEPATRYIVTALQATASTNIRILMLISFLNKVKCSTFKPLISIHCEACMNSQQQHKRHKVMAGKLLHSRRVITYPSSFNASPTISPQHCLPGLQLVFDTIKKVRKRS